MIIGFIILAIAVVVLAYFYATVRINNHMLCLAFGDELAKKDREYAALEQGRDEESEAYEQQYLSFMETIENQANAINSYIEDLHFLVRLGDKHFEHCLPDLGEADMERFFTIRGSVLLEDG